MPKVLLLILDGWGYRKEKRGNAIALAKTPVFDRLWKNNPHTILKASGPAVGLPERFMGNSEVGHLTIGAGRIIDSDLVRINNAINNGLFFKNNALLSAVNHAKEKKQKLHLVGLLSDSGVHSHINHLFALLELAKRKGVQEVYVHAFLDGRDTPPKAAAKYITQLQQKMKQLGVGTLATMMGRFYAMDRDNRWGREHKAYDCMVNCIGRKRNDPLEALAEAYAKGETDEYVKPTIFTKKCVVDENDSVLFFNFRSDRARELTRAFVWGKFKEFQRKKIIGLKFVTLTQYDSLVKVPVAFPPIVPEQTLGEVISNAGLSQLRIAETEKWAHVTYFFNGLHEPPYENEYRIIIPSEKTAHHDEHPEMMSEEITKRLLQGITDPSFSFIFVNYANSDIIAHSGNYDAALKAVDSLDIQLGRIVEACLKEDVTLVITADHGNLETMIDSATSRIETKHNPSPVPFYLVDKRFKRENTNTMIHKSENQSVGTLADVAPTVLEIMGIPQPISMTGQSLLKSIT